MIYKKTLFVEVLLSSILVAILHYIATAYSLYWSIDWYDILMHFLGGWVIGLIAFFAFFSSGKIDFPNDHKLLTFIIVVGAVVVVGLAWELWELFFGFSDVYTDLPDTILDLIMDIIGGFCAFYYGIKKTWQKN